MTTDLWMLVWTAVLALGLPFIYLAGLARTSGGMAWGLSNRAEPLAGVPEWAARTQRAHLNLLQNLAPFAVLVLVAQISGKADATTALGATIFFWARVAHAAVYIAGIKYLRTLVFAIATVGAVLILGQLF
ncbi:MAG TPA: MAPEG family protein [Candidatus Binataceae bacterium]|nr:MAPEG family protein [Candidatus Binataceae bacterium]